MNPPEDDFYKSIYNMYSDKQIVELNGITECFNQSKYSVYIVSDTLFLIFFIAVEIMLVTIIFIYL